MPKTSYGFLIDDSNPYYTEEGLAQLLEETNETKRPSTVEMLRQHGGAGSGHHGHKGRPGKVGGSLPSGLGFSEAPPPPLKFKRTKAQIEQTRNTVREHAREIGIPDEVLEFPNRDGKKTAYGPPLATYYRKEDKIRIWKSTFLYKDADEIIAILAHEWTHRLQRKLEPDVFWGMMQTVADSHSRKFPYRGQRGDKWTEGYYLDIFKDSDGVTGYSKLWWKMYGERLVGNDRIVGETLAEVARLRALGRYGEVDLIWRDALEALESIK